MNFTLALGAAEPLAVKASPGANLATFAVASVVVIALAYVASRLLGNWQAVQTRGRRLRVLEGVPIGKDRSLLLVAVGKEILVLGSAPTGVNLVHRVEDPRQAAELLNDDTPDNGAATGATGTEESIRNSLNRMRTMLTRAGGSPHA